MSPLPIPGGGHLGEQQLGALLGSTPSFRAVYLSTGSPESARRLGSMPSVIVSAGPTPQFRVTDRSCLVTVIAPGTSTEKLCRARASGLGRSLQMLL